VVNARASPQLSSKSNNWMLLIHAGGVYRGKTVVKYVISLAPPSDCSGPLTSRRQHVGVALLTAETR
jgi:hypothetical protein